MTRLSSRLIVILAPIARLAPLALLALAAAPLRAPLQAQSAPAEPPLIRTVSYPNFGGALGIAVPVGGFADAHDAGFNLAAVTELRVPTEQVGVRGEATYQYYPAKAPQGKSGSTLALTVNALYHVPGLAWRPYLIGGMGLHQLPGAAIHPGLNAGAGIDIPLVGVRAYVEARVHHAITGRTAYTAVPISFGMLF